MAPQIGGVPVACPPGGDRAVNLAGKAVLEAGGEEMVISAEEYAEFAALRKKMEA